jgi:hypothetical protein
MRRAPRGFASILVTIVIGATAVVACSLIVWQLNARVAVVRHARAREFQHEVVRLRLAVLANIRQALQTANPALFAGCNTVLLGPQLSADPRFPNSPPGGATTPGFTLSSFTLPAPPVFFVPGAPLAVPGGGSPVDGLRQNIHDVAFAYVLARRLSPADTLSQLTSQNGAFHVRLREIPITDFALVAPEALNLDAGIHFVGPSLVLGPSTRSAGALDLRLTPQQVDLTQIGASDRVWMNPGLYASLLVPPGTLCDPTAATFACQNLGARGQALSFDGRTITAGDAPLPAGIAVANYQGAPRVIVDLKALPQWNCLLDSAAGNVPANELSAYHIHCTTPLARDRGVVLLGTSAARSCDLITTDGALILSGQHTGGPVLAGSSFGAVWFDNAGDTSWNAYLVLSTPEPWLTATSALSTPNGARPINLAAGEGDLALAEQCFDSVTVKVTPASGVAFTVGLGSTTLSQNLAWVEGDGSNVRLGVYSPGGNTYSASLPCSGGEIDLTLSRTLAMIKLSYPGGVLYWPLPAARRRIETSALRWSGGISLLEIWSSGAGATLGSTNPGVVSLRGLLALGRISSFGAGTFQFTPTAGGDPLEAIAPRLVVLQP